MSEYVTKSQALLLPLLSTLKEYLIKNKKSLLVSFLLLSTCHISLFYILQLILKRTMLSVLSMDMFDFTKDYFQTKLNALFQMPLPFKIPMLCKLVFKRVELTLGLQTHYRAMAQLLNLKPLQLESSQPSPKLMEGKCVIKETDDFLHFSQKLLTESQAKMTLCSKIDLYLFFIPFRNLYYETEIKLLGLEGLKRMKVFKVEVLEGRFEKIILQVYFEIENPSVLTLQFPQLFFQYQLDDSGPLGRIEMNNLILKPGKNQLDAVGTFEPNAKDSKLGMELLGNFLGGISTEILVSGMPDSLNPEWTYLAPALSQLQIETEMPGLTQPLLTHATMKLGFRMEGTVFIQNPFPVELVIVWIKAKMSNSGEETQVASLDLDARQKHFRRTSQQVSSTNSPARMRKQQSELFGGGSSSGSNTATEEPYIFKVQPNQTVESPALPISISIGSGALNALLQMSVGRLMVDLDVEMGCFVGQYYLNGLSYSQEYVPVEVS